MLYPFPQRFKDALLSDSLIRSIKVLHDAFEETDVLLSRDNINLSDVGAYCLDEYQYQALLNLLSELSPGATYIIAGSLTDIDRFLIIIKSSRFLRFLSKAIEEERYYFKSSDVEYLFTKAVKERIYTTFRSGTRLDRCVLFLQKKGLISF